MISDTEREQTTTMVGTTVAEPFTTIYEETYFNGEMIPPDTYLEGGVIGPPVTESVYTAGTEIGTTTTTTTADEWGGTSMVGTQVGPYTTTTTETTYLAGTWVDSTTTTCSDDTWFAGEIMDVIYGDTNSDGKTSISDSVAILQFIANQDKYPMTADARAAADCYNPGDGITPMDALTIQRVDAGEIAEYDLPVYPDCESGAC